MNTGILVGSAAFLMMAGCVTSTTTNTTTFEETDDAASQYYQLGARYYRNGNYNLARERLERALELDPKMANAHYTLALTYEQLENIRLATEHYNEAVSVAPDNFDARNAYAVFLCRQQQFDEAVKQFDRAVKVRVNDNPEVMLTNAGACMTQKPDYKKAEEYFRAALQRRPSYCVALLQLAALKHKTDENLHARAFLQRYLSCDKASAEVLYLGMQIEKSLGDDRAISDYMNQLLTDFPESLEAKRAREAG
jgi:type IV pilus assembly protein PilF